MTAVDSGSDESGSALKADGYGILVFAAVGVYLFFHMAQVATGGPAMPLGRPLLRS
jgi:uncharacterized protein